MKISFLFILILINSISSCDPEMHGHKYQKGNIYNSILSEKDSSSFKLQHIYIAEDTLVLFVPLNFNYKPKYTLLNNGKYIGYHLQSLYLGKDSNYSGSKIEQIIVIEQEGMHFEKFNSLEEFKKEIHRRDKSIVFVNSRTVIINSIPFLLIEGYSDDENKYVINLQTVYKTKLYSLTWTFLDSKVLIDSLTCYKSINSIKIKTR